MSIYANALIVVESGQSGYSAAVYAAQTGHEIEEALA